ncbi:hypothetical protein NPA11_01760 [Mycoplasma sp. 1578d]|uniref:MIP family Ig-specific serine endopeptidase n=1 Tax=Mycoplasma sp. 1578d TaxID=2967299 RepID=UPI00211CCD49|nr:hypothetical protein [Mycoplasma sp. 1578d]UUM20131.1 hypothetical protein NPA11_01760 [Mycoplasma sp. 1578d]
MKFKKFLLVFSSVLPIGLIGCNLNNQVQINEPVLTPPINPPKEQKNQQPETKIQSDNNDNNQQNSSNPENSKIVPIDESKDERPKQEQPVNKSDSSINNNNNNSVKENDSEPKPSGPKVEDKPISVPSSTPNPEPVKSKIITPSVLTPAKLKPTPKPVVNAPVKPIETVHPKPKPQPPVPKQSDATKPKPKPETVSPKQIETLAKFTPSIADKSTYLKDNDQYIQSIKRRTFSLRWSYDEFDPEKLTVTKKITTSGTIWLLDYAHIQKGRFKLYFGTNYHVASNLFSSRDYKIYQQPKKLQKYIPQNFQLTWAGDAYDSTPELDSYNWYSARIGFDSQIITFRNFFLAQNFMDKQSVPAEYGPYFADFAVIEMDVDLNALYDIYLSSNNISARNLIIKIEGAINELNRSIARFKKPNDKNTYLLNNKSLPYATLDYATVRNIGKWSQYSTPNELSNLLNQYLSTYQYALAPQNLYSFGYPSSGKGGLEIYKSIQNSQKDTLGPDKTDPSLNFSINDNFHFRPFDKDSQYFNNQVAMKFYGFLDSFQTQNGPKPGASGSLILNEQALPVGLLLGHLTLTNQHGQPINNDSKISTVLFQPFSLNQPIFSPYTKSTIQAYNLIDHTSSKLYPHQKVSYRSRLNDVYGKDFKTAIFGGQLVNFR